MKLLSCPLKSPTTVPPPSTSSVRVPPSKETWKSKDSIVRGVVSSGSSGGVNSAPMPSATACSPSWMSPSRLSLAVKEAESIPSTRFEISNLSRVTWPSVASITCPASCDSRMGMKASIIWMLS
ncbi:hypothetical protein ES703_117362 [subsurface metagenome]